MPASPWSLSLRRALGLVTCLTLAIPALASSASRAASLDKVTAMTVATPGVYHEYSNVNIHAQSGPSGQDPSGTAAFTIVGIDNVAGPVTCLSVTGPDHGGGAPGQPTTAVLNLQDPVFGVVTVVLTDNGGNHSDVINSAPLGRAPTDCSLPVTPPGPFTLDNGRAVVIDAPVLPTAKDQCRHDGWRNYSQFTNQRECLESVAHG